MEELLTSVIAIALLAYLVKKLIFPAKKGLIALDMGGVFAEGDYFTAQVRERKGMRDIVKRLKRNYNVALLSNQNSEAHALFEKKFGLPKLFDGQVVSGRVGMKKPDKKIFNLLLQRFNARPGKTVFIDDAQENVAAARKLGIRSVQFVSTEQMLTDLRKTGVKV